MHLAAVVIWGGVTIGGVATAYAYTNTIASHLHSLLPPWDDGALEAFPTLQKYYRLFIYFLGYAAGNYRSRLWQSISTENGTRQSDVVTKKNGQ